MRARTRFAIAVVSWLLCSSWVVTPATALTVHGGVAYDTDGPYTWYYAMQATATQDSSSFNAYPYYGWDGVRGYAYWKTNGQFNSQTVQFSAPLSLATSEHGWYQAGLTQLNNVGGLTGLWGYIEPNDPDDGDEDNYPRYYYSVTPPTVVYVWVFDDGLNQWGQHVWTVRMDEDEHAAVDRTFADDAGSGQAAAYAEMMQISGASAPASSPELYFGTNTTGYNGSAYILQLLGAGGWENWDESLTAGVTSAWDYHNRWHYSVGYPCYYFGAWDLY